MRRGAEQVRERLHGALGEGREAADGRLKGGVARRLVLGLERGIVGQPATQRPLRDAAASRGLPDRGLGRSARIAWSRTAAV